MTDRREATAVLEEAFRRFESTSLDLERSYHALQAHIAGLTTELEEKNQALRDSLEVQAHLREQAERNRRLAAVGEMAARMAHELRNPLGSVELFASLLVEALDDDPPRAEWARHILEAVRAMEYALSNLLAFTRTPVVRIREVPLRPLLDQVLGLLGPSADCHGIAIRTALDDLPLLVRCDEDLLRQAMLNVLLNAIEAMPDHGTLTVSGRGESDGGFSLSVRDTGIGIPDDIRPRIFDPFFSTKPRGTGLGLAIAHHAVTAHGGTVSVDSAQGAGTMLTIAIPALAVPSESSEGQG